MLVLIICFNMKDIHVKLLKMRITNYKHKVMKLTHISRNVLIVPNVSGTDPVSWFSCRCLQDKPFS
jgi:hypothetical protein